MVVPGTRLCLTILCKNNHVPFEQMSNFTEGIETNEWSGRYRKSMLLDNNWTDKNSKASFTIFFIQNNSISTGGCLRDHDLPRDFDSSAFGRVKLNE